MQSFDGQKNDDTEKKQHRIQLFNYRRGEEIFNWISHLTGSVIAIAGLVLGVIFAAVYSDTFGVVSMAIYGASMVLLYLNSTIYHALPQNNSKRVYRVLDHCTIFFLIAGTYTPYCLVALRNSGAWGWTIFGIVWGMSILGTVLTAVNMQKFKVFSMICYIAIGWIIIIAFKPLAAALPTAGLVLLITGGVIYTVGAVLFGLGKKIPYMHSVWHLFCIAGTVTQYLSVLLYVIIKI